MAKRAGSKAVKKPVYYQVTDGEWIEVPMRNHFDQCCDCGLVHKMNFRVNDRGKIEIQAYRHARATNAARIHFRFTRAED